MEKRLNMVEANREELQKKYSDATENLLQARREIKKLQGREDLFRGIIVDKASTQKVSDQDIISKFLSIRQLIQQVAHSKIFDYETPPHLPPNAEDDMVNWYGLWKLGLSRKDLVHRTRGKIFRLLYEQVFVKRLFGLERLDRPVWSEMETGLATFEGLITRRMKGIYLSRC